MTKVAINLAAEKSLGGPASENRSQKKLNGSVLHFSDFCIGNLLFLYYPLPLLQHPLDKIVR
jgi:hypothetical protein